MDQTVQNTEASQATSGSRNTIIIAIGAVLLLLGVGVYYVLGKSVNKPLETSKVAISPTAAPANAFSSIQDALSKSLSLQCEYGEDGKKTIAYIKSGSVRADMTGGTTAENGSIIVKDDMMYFWNGKQGMMMKFDKEAMTSTAGTPSANPSKAPNADFMEGLEKYKDACKPSVVSDSLFTPPADVKFIDQTKMMEGAQKMMKGVTPGQSMNEEQIKTMMQQYQPTTTP
ncbi:MAG: hypothetical protein KBD46_00655 [Candidatus Levybacteria bacterium]|nr:hypothetical protein [Candidatus Levybacteria bacterium]